MTILEKHTIKIATILGKKAGSAAWKKLARNDRILSVLKEVGIASLSTESKFEDVYAHTLVEYGVDKSNEILEFFRDKTIQKAFREYFRNKNEKVLNEKTDKYIAQYKIGDDIKKKKIDPHIEFIEFSKIFESNVNKTCRPVDTRIERTLERMENKFDNLTPALNLEFSQNLEYAQTLLDKRNPVQALDLLFRLEKRINISSSNKLRYEFVSKKAIAKKMLDEHFESAQLFIEACNYDKNNPKAVSNAAMAYFQLGEKLKAKNLLLDIIKNNPANAYIRASWIIVISEEKSVEEIINEIPLSLLDSWEIAQAIGVVASQKRALEISESWFRKAIEKWHTPWPEIYILLAGILQEQTKYYDLSFSATGLALDQREKVRESIELITKAWDIVKNTDLRAYKIE